MPPRERAFPAAGFSRDPPLSPFYLTGEDHLRVRAFNQVRAATVEVAYRFWTQDDGRIQVLRSTFPLGVPLDDQTREFRLPAGALLNVRLSVSAGSSVTLGELFTRAQLIRGAGAVATVLSTILQGYVSPSNDRGWPGSPLEDEHSTRGVIRNADWDVNAAPPSLSRSVDAGLRWLVLCGAGILTTSAAAGNRSPFVRVSLPGGVIIYEAYAEQVVLPSTLAPVSFAAGVSSWVAPIAEPVIPWPSDLELSPTSSVTLGVVGDQAGDAYTARGLYVRQWFEG